MGNLFLKEIKDWETWSEVYQDIPAFEALINKIFEKEGLECSNISHLTAGTNAVFKVDNLVVKIFAPVESGFDTEIDYGCEILGMKRAMSLGINLPKVIAASAVQDKYLFRYIIMEHIDGKDAKDVLKNYSTEKKRAFAGQLKENLFRMNTVFNDKFPAVDVKERALENSRWNIIPEEVVTQARSLLRSYEMSNRVYVHGDITGENVMITEEGRLYIIDFADGRIAPEEYELPPILFDLFDFDKTMIDEFVKGQSEELIVEKCFYGILMHEFGSYFVKLICERVLGKQVGELDNILEIKAALATIFHK